MPDRRAGGILLVHTAVFPSLRRRAAERASSRRRRVASLLAATLALGSVATLATLTGPAQAAERGSQAGATHARKAYSPTTGVMFNDPLGSTADKRRLVDHVINTINSTPPKSLIRMAVFSFADPAVANALINAYHRGVRVKLIFSDNTVYGPMRHLQQVLGGNRSAKSFAYWCTQSCRGPKGQMHAKYFAFRRAGSSEFVTMVGSVNLTRYNAEKQWNDLYTVSDDKSYYAAYNRWWKQLKVDQPIAQPFSSRVVGLNNVEMTPLDPTLTPDPVLDALSRVQCLVPKTSIDPTWPDPSTMVPTRILVSAHAWNGDRGRNVAFKIAELQRSGCQVQVLYGVGTGSAVTSILAAAGVALSGGTHKGIRTHQKVMVIAGGYDGIPSTYRAWTGSHNWSDRALQRDDLIVRIDNPQLAEQYVYLFDQMWALA
jgi:phosphatidylserine/phosphatidylglycerophosphate/cardiolipin synthase-like enzyme